MTKLQNMWIIIFLKLTIYLQVSFYVDYHFHLQKDKFVELYPKKFGLNFLHKT